MGRGKVKAPVERDRPDVHKAMSHRLRVEILMYLVENVTGTPATMARALGASLVDVSHHTKQLASYGMAELVEERPAIRGSNEHVYKATARPEVTSKDLEEMDPEGRGVFVGQIIGNVLADIAEASRGGTLTERTDWHLTHHVPLNLDAEGYEELRKAHMEVFEKTYEIQARSKERRAESGEAAMRVSSTQFCFELPARNIST